MKYIKLLLCFFITINIYAQTDKYTPELLWKLGRVSEPELSPDGKTVLFGVTFYKLEENKGNRDLFIVPSTGGAMKHLTDTKHNEINAVWRPDGKKIGFISSEGGSMQIWEMNPDGSEKNQISNFNRGINGFIYSPAMNYILFVSDVKLDKTANDIHPDLPLANAKIIDDLMYRHWDDWHDYSYSHIFIVNYNNGSLGIPEDIMDNERYDSPISAFGGMEQITFSPDGNYIAYTCKKLSGKEDAVSTNSDIFLYDIKNKATVNLSETMEGYDFNPSFSPDGTKLIWLSMKTPGFESDKKRIILMDLNTKKVKNITKNFDQSSDNLIWSEDSRKIYFISGINATFQIYSSDINTKYNKSNNKWMARL